MEIISTSDALLQEYGVYLLGKNLELAQAEVESLVITTTESSSFQWHGRFGIFKCDNEIIKIFEKRAVLAHEIGKVLHSANDVANLIQNIHLSVFDSKGEETSFAVKVLDIDSVLKSGEKETLAAQVGSHVRSLTNWTVSLKQPERIFTVFVSQGKFILCESFATNLFKQLIRIHPKQYPFFHPSMMNSVLARVMCNIAGVQQSQVILDPFCGGGGILIEAAKIGAKVIGIDRTWRLLNGARANLNSIKGANFNLIQGDSRYLPLYNIDCIVTDPPYGKTSSTLGTENTELVQAFIGQLMDWEQLDAMCICADSNMDLNQFFLDQRLEVTAYIPIRVHKSLTREVFRIKF